MRLRSSQLVASLYLVADKVYGPTGFGLKQIKSHVKSQIKINSEVA